MKTKTYSIATITRIRVKNGIIYNEDLKETIKETRKFINKYRKAFENLAKLI